MVAGLFPLSPISFCFDVVGGSMFAQLSFDKYEGREVGVGGLALALAWFDHMSGDGIEIDVDAVSRDELEDIKTGGLDSTFFFHLKSS